MYNKAGGDIASPYHRNDVSSGVVTDLARLIEYVQTSLRLIEQAIACEPFPGNQDSNVIVLDDVSPRYVKATAALQACDARLAEALQSLQDANNADAR